jgi:glycosyltransferase domain-containing protein
MENEHRYGTCLHLLLPTHNRTQKLNRTLNFLAGEVTNSRANFTLHLIDSSDREERSKNAALVASLENKLSIVHHDYFGYDFYQKYLSVLQICESHVVCTFGDDDFINLRAVSDAYEFLISHPDYGSANGQVITVDPRKRVCNAFNLYPQSFPDDFSTTSRVIKHLGNYRTNFYSVARASGLMEKLHEVCAAPVGRHLKERLMAVATVICGKREQIPGVFLVREKSGETGYDEKGRRTLSDDPRDHNHLEIISFGYNDYERAVLSWLPDNTDKEQIELLLKSDFILWQRNQSRRRAGIFSFHRLLKRLRPAVDWSSSHTCADREFLLRVERALWTKS